MVCQPSGGFGVFGVDDDIAGAFAFGVDVLRKNTGKGFGRVAAPDNGAFAGLFDGTTGAGTVNGGMDLAADHRVPLAGIGMIGAPEKVHKAHLEQLGKPPAGTADGGNCLRTALGFDILQLFSYFVERIVPGNFPPFSLTPLTDSLQGIIETVFMIEVLDKGFRTLANPAMVHRMSRFALQFGDFSVLDRGQ